jgi:O-methyltransferase involved in polyketide biosynthesis
VGLLYYFEQEGVQTVFDHIGTIASGATVVTDFCSTPGVAAANKLVLGNSEQTKMIWSADTDDDIRTVCPNLKTLETYPLFAKISPLLAGQDAQLAVMSDAKRTMSFAVIDLP